MRRELVSKMIKKGLFHHVMLLVFLLVSPVKGLCFETGEVLIVTDKNMYRLNVQVARTPEDWQQGARALDGLKQDEGIFFLYPRETIPTFSTKGLPFPLDILLVDKEGHIVGIFEKAFGDKYSALPRAAVAALQVAGGFCERMGVSIGDRVNPLDISLKPKEVQAPRQEERKRVEAQLKANIEKHPTDPESYEELAVFYTLNRENEKAARTFRDLL